MSKRFIIPIFVGAIVLFFLFWNSLKFKPDNWIIEYKNLGSSSSPQAVDLNGDGILDIVVGAGDKEFVHTDRAVLALNGVDGSVLWKVSARNQVVGSPVFLDITKDGTPDVIIGGRSALLFGIDGKSGKVLWEYLPDTDELDAVNDTSVLNFYNPQIIPDVNGDNVEDILTAYGGFIKAKPSEKDRPNGYLLIVNSLNGEVLKKAAVPDGAETYMSPVVYDFDGNGELEVIFGTGGETLNGHLFKVPLSSVLNQDLSGSIILDSGLGKGFIAPPILADVNDDNVPEILINSVNGRAICIDGKSNKKLWEVSLGEGFEIYTSPAIGNFSGDKSREVFVSFGKGTWPVIRSSINVTLEALTGKILTSDTLGTFQYASPVVIDISEDGYDDILFAINQSATQETLVGGFKYLENRLVVYNINDNITFVFDKPKVGTNLGSTPLLTDLDNDGHIDVIYCFSNDGTDSFSFSRMAIQRIEIDSDPKLIRWPSYMGGANYKSYYP